MRISGGDGCTNELFRTDFNMKKLLIIGTALIIFVLAFASLIGTREAIPDNAKFAVDVQQQIVVPAPVPGRYTFHEIPGRDDDFWGRTITWAELREKNGPYQDFNFPDTPEWNEFELYGPEVSLLRSWIAKPESRWDENGFWRY